MSNHYEIQVKSKDEGYEWRSMHYGDGPEYPYKYKTYEEALESMGLAYPPKMTSSDMETRIVVVSSDEEQETKEGEDDGNSTDYSQRNT